MVSQRSLAGYARPCGQHRHEPVSLQCSCSMRRSSPPLAEAQDILVADTAAKKIHKPGMVCSTTLTTFTFFVGPGVRSQVETCRSLRTRTVAHQELTTPSPLPTYRHAAQVTIPSPKRQLKHMQQCRAALRQTSFALPRVQYGVLRYVDGAPREHMPTLFVLSTLGAKAQKLPAQRSASNKSSLGGGSR